MTAVSEQVNDRRLTTRGDTAHSCAPLPIRLGSKELSLQCAYGT